MGNVAYFEGIGSGGLQTPNSKLQTELLAPAGDFETALAAFDAGADAVYCGLAAFSARAFAKNLSGDELRALMRVAKAKGRKVYVTFNTLIEEAELGDAVEKLALLDEIGVDGIIVQDLGVARIAREFFPGLALHASTQLVAHNLEGVLALKELGFVRVVLARELTLAEIESIAKRCGVEIECFIHGALCYSLSGLCLFSAMENDRSGNRGKCAYCCRMESSRGLRGLRSLRSSDGCNGCAHSSQTSHTSQTSQTSQTFPFSMRDMRLGEDVRKLVAAGVKSLKIEGRMKSSLYVASAVRHYREILDGMRQTVTNADLETVFSRRTTKLYLNGRSGDEDVLDSSSLGHVGTPIGIVKRVTKDREGRSWLRFHTNRALERHDGLQIVSPDGAKKCGFGISEMRQAISRQNVFEVGARSDVEVLLTREQAEEISSGDTVCCSMSNEMKRRFPAPVYRPSDYPGTDELDVTLKISPTEISAEARGIRVTASGSFAPAKNPGATRGAAEKAFAKLGDTDYSLVSLTLEDPQKLFAPVSILNELRRELVQKLDDERADRRAAKISAALGGTRFCSSATEDEQELVPPAKRVKIRAGQEIPPDTWDEIIIVCSSQFASSKLQTANSRLALPVFTPEGDFNKLRVMVKRYMREGFMKWEASDLATLRMLKALGVTDITADWTIYTFNSAAIAALRELGVRRVVASPENSDENLDALASIGFDVEFLTRQSTPLFISLNKPGDGCEPFVVRREGPLWITTRREPRRFQPPPNTSTRLDLSWDVL